MSRHAGYHHSPEVREKISTAVRTAWATGRKKSWAWQPPEEFHEMYRDLKAKLGPSEARQLVEDHAATVARRTSGR